MCTLTIFPVGKRHIITMSRDEAVARKEGLPLTVNNADGTLRFWHPVDRWTGGTWFGVHASGTVLALLNRYQESAPPAIRSRGTLIPQILAILTEHPHDQVLQASSWTDRNWAEFAPCDLVAFMNGAIRQLSWDGTTLASTLIPADRPFLLTSTSSDREDVMAYRHRLFDLFVSEQQAPSADTILQELHLQAHPHNPSLGMRMHRPGRHTKSICQAHIGDHPCSYRYLPLKEQA